MSTAFVERQKRSKEEIERLLEEIPLGRLLRNSDYGPPAAHSTSLDSFSEAIAELCGRCSRGEGILAAFVMIRTLFETKVALKLAQDQQQTRRGIVPSLARVTVR